MMSQLFVGISMIFGCHTMVAGSIPGNLACLGNISLRSVSLLRGFILPGGEELTLQSGPPLSVWVKSVVLYYGVGPAFPLVIVFDCLCGTPAGPSVGLSEHISPFSSELCG